MRISWPAVTCAFITGVVTGLLLAPRSGQETRRELASKARARLHTLEAQLQQLEAHLQQLERHFQAMSEHFRKAGEETSWELKNQDIARELRRMPHG